MLRHLVDSVHRFLLHPQWGWVGLWLGLAVLIVALTVMICTSWGQSHPLRKCAGLSLLAHLLLFGYATTIQIVTGSGNGHHGGGMNLLLVDGSDVGSDVGIDDPTAPVTNEPWVRPPPGEPNDPPIDSANRDHSTAIVAQVPKETTSRIPMAPSLLDVPQPPTPPPLLESTAIKPKEPIESSPPPVASTPGVPDLPPVTSTVENTKPIDKPSEPLPAPPAEASLPKLPEPPTTPDVGDWVAGSPAGGNLSNQTATEGPLKENPKAGSDSSSGELTSTGRVGNQSAANPVGAKVIGPLVETVDAPIATRGVPEIYADRLASDRVAIGRQRGGSPEAESAVQAALRWLATSQNADGRWSAEKFGGRQEIATPPNQRQGPGGDGSKADTAVTGLALLAFLGAGNTHVQGDYSASVQHGLEFLIGIQGSDGSLAGPSETYAFMYSHGMATLALSEAYAMTGDKRLEPAVQAAINYTLRAQIRSTGGWRYRAGESPVERGDTSQLGWQLMSLKSADLAGIKVPSNSYEGAVRFLKSVSTDQHPGKASYRPGELPSRPMSAEALVCRQFLGMSRENPASNEAGDYLLAQLPSGDRINLYYWYYGTMGMYQLQGEYWQRWNEALQQTLVNRQRLDGDLSGSWDPECIWGGYGGRVYSTAMATLCLEVYYRYLPIYRLAGRQPSAASNR